MLGHLGIALERDQGSGRRDDVSMGQEYDVEGHSPDCRPESEGVPKGGEPEQAGDAGGGSPTGARPGAALLGYSDPPGFNILTQDILLKKSPKRLMHILCPYTIRVAKAKAGRPKSRLSIMPRFYTATFAATR